MSRPRFGSQASKSRAGPTSLKLYIQIHDEYVGPGTEASYATVQQENLHLGLVHGSESQPNLTRLSLAQPMKTVLHLFKKILNIPSRLLYSQERPPTLGALQL